MTIRKLLIAGALASATAFVVTPAFAAPAPPPASGADEDCDDIMEQLKELNDDLLQNRSAARTPVAVCAALGQLLGVAKASKEVANECYDDEKKKQDLAAALEKTQKDLEGQVGNFCK